MSGNMSMLCHGAPQLGIGQAMVCDMRRSLAEAPVLLYLDNLAFLVSGAASRVTTGP